MSVKTDNEHYARVEKYAKEIQNLYFEIADYCAKLATNHSFESGIFTFKDYPVLNRAVDKLISDLRKSMHAIIQSGISKEWDKANENNDEFIERLLKKTSIPAQKYQTRNLKALEAFQNRKINGLKLSDRVWNYSAQYKTELEQALDVGIADGRSAAQLSRDIREYLREPEKLFRRIRDKNGNLKPSKNALRYNPGNGVYRSSYKNAMRLTRTEINSSYREADYLRWQQMDFVVGIEIRRSNREYACDVCESLKGKYPKDFKFTGWHPHCRCHAIPILSTEKELLDSIENDTIVKSKNEVKDVPDSFKDWVSENENRINGAKSKPWWMNDNNEFINVVEKKIPELSLSEIKKHVNNNSMTENIFKIDGEWNVDRRVLHNKIINEYMSGEKVSSDKVYMLGGATANGKSTLTNSGSLPHPKGVLVIDADKIKSAIPEYDKMLKSGNDDLVKAAANFVHEESSYIGKIIQEKAFKGNWGSVIDGINDGAFEKVNNRANAIRQATGKPIRADYVSLDSSLSLKLAQARYEKTGRFVPLNYVEKVNREVSILIPEVIKNKTFDELYLWDTNINGKPRLILKQINGKLTMYDKALYERFLNKTK